MTLSLHNLPTRQQMAPDKVLPTDAHSVQVAQKVLNNNRLMYQDPTGWAVTGLQIGEQAFAAARTVSLLQLGQTVLRGQDPTGGIVRVMACVAAPLALNALKEPLAVQWISNVRDRYDDAFVINSFNKPSTWVLGKDIPAKDGKEAVTSAKAARTVLYAGNLRWHADNQVSSALALQSQALACGANMVMLYATMGASMGLAQVAALALVMAYGKRAFNTISATTAAQTEADNALGAHMRRLWDNITLGNAPSVDRWQGRYNTLRGRADTMTQQTAKANAQRDLTLMALAAGPMMLGLAAGLYLAATETGPVGKREQLQNILLQGPALVSATRNIVAVSEKYWNGYQKRQKQLEVTLGKSLMQPSLTLMEHCFIDNIEATHNGVTLPMTSVLPMIVDAAKSYAPGHFIITGRNGAGKSMLLLQLKEWLGPDLSVLLPSDVGQMEFGIRNQSVGETDLAASRQVLASAAHVKLLDEPSAHLHPSSIKILNGLIKQATAPKSLGGAGQLVVEISHRVGNAEEATRAG